MKKKKILSEKIESAKPNSKIELSAKDRADQWRRYERLIEKEKEDHFSYLFLFLGLIFGIFGSYVSTQIYDFSKNIILVRYGFEKYFLFNIFIWIIFGLLLSVFVVKLVNNTKKIKELRRLQKLGFNAKFISVGEIYSPEFMEEFNYKVNQNIQDIILKELVKKDLTIWRLCKKLNLPLGIILPNIKNLEENGRIKSNKRLFIKKYKLNSEQSKK